MLGNKKVGPWLKHNESYYSYLFSKKSNDVLGDGSEIASFNFDNNSLDLHETYSGWWKGLQNYSISEYGLSANFFNNGKNYIELPNEISDLFKNSNSVWSLSIFFTFTGLYEANNTILDFNSIFTIKQDGSSINLSVILRVDDETKKYVLVDNTTEIIYGIEMDKKYHLVVTNENGLYKLYINNELIVEKNVYRPTDSTEKGNLDKCFIGKNTFDTIVSNGSLVDELRIFDKAINSEEIKIIYEKENYAYVGEYVYNKKPPTLNEISLETNIFKDNSIISYFKFEDSLYDEITKEYGVSHGDVYYREGIVYKGIVFNGEDASADIMPTYSTNDTKTVSLWAMKKDDRDYAYILNSGYYINSNNNVLETLMMGNNDNKINLILRTGTEIVTLFSASEIKYNVWYHIVYTLNKETNIAKLYINGVLESSGNIILLDTTSSLVKLAGHISGDSLQEQWLNGAIDNLRVFDKELSPFRISCLYNEINREWLNPFLVDDAFNDKSTVLYYKFDDNYEDAIINYPTTDTNAPLFVEGIRNNAVKFGNVQYLTLNNPLIMGTKFSISAWVKIGDFDFDYFRTLIGFDYNDTISNDNYSWFIGIWNNRPAYSIDSDVTWPTINDDEWHSIIWNLNIDDKLIEIYLDGVLLGDIPMRNALNQNKIDQIGAFKNSYRSYNEYIIVEELRIFNKLLSQEEVTLIHEDKIIVGLK